MKCWIFTAVLLLALVSLHEGKRGARKCTKMRKFKTAICASDSVTYTEAEKFCKVKKASLLTEQKIKFVHFGECGICTQENVCPKFHANVKRGKKRENKLKRKLEKKADKFGEKKMNKLLTKVQKKKCLFDAEDGTEYKHMCFFYIKKCQRQAANEKLPKLKRRPCEKTIPETQGE